MQAGFEEQIVANPLWGGISLWEFTRQYESHRVPVRYPSLILLLPVLPILLHRPSAQRLKRMYFDSGLTKFLVDDPTIILNLQDRMIAFASTTLRSINIACASGLLEKVDSTVGISFRCKLQALPNAIQPDGIAKVTAQAARRLGAFFRDETALQLEAKLRIFF